MMSPRLGAKNFSTEISYEGFGKIGMGKRKLPEKIFVSVACLPEVA
jgi:hypothetical protein